MPYAEGRLLDIIDTIKTWIDTEWGRFYATSYTTTDYRTPLKDVIAFGFPAASIRVDSDGSREVFFGRRRTSTIRASVFPYILTIHVHAKKGTGTHVDEAVMLATQRIENMLTKKNHDKNVIFAHGIHAIDGIGSRPSNPRARNVSRMIITANIGVLVPDITTSTSTSTTSTSTTSTSTTSTTSTTSPP